MWHYYCSYPWLVSQTSETIRGEMNNQRLLIISLEKETVTRASERTAHRRNKYVEELADELRQIHLFIMTNLKVDKV